jgi:hypothetical protein
MGDFASAGVKRGPRGRVAHVGISSSCAQGKSARLHLPPRRIADSERERVAGQQHLESSAAVRCSDSAVPALQSHGSSPFSNRFASSSSSPTNPGGSPPFLLHPGAPGSSSASQPAPPPAAASHGHRFLFFSLLSLCSVAFAHA